MQVHEVPATTTEREFTVARRSQTQMIIRRFMAHKLAVGSLVVFLLVVIISLIGGRFWKYGYADITDEFSSPPSLSTRWGPTTSATTRWPRCCAAPRSRSRWR